MKQQYTYRLPFFFIKILTLIEKRSYKVICIKMKTSFIQLILLVFLSAVFTDSGMGKAVLDRTVTIPGNLPTCPVQFIRQAITAHDGTIWVAGEQAGIHRLLLKDTYNEFWEDMRYFPGAPDTLAFFSHNNSGSSTLSRIETVQQYGDGSSLVCFYLASESLPEGGYVTVEMTAGGAQFLDGGTKLTVRAEDFGSDGLFRVLMTAPRGTATSLCHIIRYYDKDGKEL